MSKDHLFRSMKHGGGNGRKLTHSAKLRFIRIRDWFAALAVVGADALEDVYRPKVIIRHKRMTGCLRAVADVSMK